jgi:tetratricopeptide (TPR) repeat protein
VYVVSFYSFKGGVGRSMTLLNVAWHLAHQGRWTAMLDLDLEAPGLENAPLRREDDRWVPPAPNTGLAEMIDRFLTESYDKAPLFDGSKLDEGAQHARRTGYLTEGLGPGGRIALLAAGGRYREDGTFDSGKADVYEEFVQSISWYDFYQKWNGRGFMWRLVDQIRELGYEYLLIDARTGLTDIAHISLHDLPDLAVLVTNLSNQSVDGIRLKVNAIRSHNETIRSQRQPSDPPLCRSGSPVETLLVASPLPRGEWQARQQKIAEAESRLGRRFDIQVDHLPLLALDESSQILAQHLRDSDSDELLVGATIPYVQLAEEISKHNPEAQENLLAAGRGMAGYGRWREALAHFDEVQDIARKLAQQRSMEIPLEDESLRLSRHEATTARLAGLNADRVKEKIDKIEAELGYENGLGETLVSEANLRYAADIVSSRIQISWTYILLNRFIEAKEQLIKARNRVAEIAAQRVLQQIPVSRSPKQPILALKPSDDGTYSFEGPYQYLPLEVRSTVGEVELFLGQAHSLCGKWQQARESFVLASGVFEDMRTRHLLHCLCLGELAIAHLYQDARDLRSYENRNDWLSPLQRSDMALAKARGLFDPGKSEDTQESSGSPDHERQPILQHGQRIRSSYIKARLQLSESQVLIARGQGVTAKEKLACAMKEFTKEGDGVGRVEVARDWSIVCGEPPEESWQFWKGLAEQLALPRVADRIGLNLLARNVAQGDKKPGTLIWEIDQIFGRWKKESEIDRDYPLMVSVSLERCRALMIKDEQTAEASKALARALELAPKPGVSEEVGRDLGLMQQLIDIVNNPDEVVEPLRQSCQEQRRWGYVLREAQTRFVLALCLARSHAPEADWRDELTQVAKLIEAPLEWDWNLPLAFLSRAPSFKDTWHTIERHLEPIWPVNR